MAAVEIFRLEKKDKQLEMLLSLLAINPVYILDSYRYFASFLRGFFNCWLVGTTTSPFASFNYDDLDK